MSKVKSDDRVYRIGIDAMGSENAPFSEVEGALLVSKLNLPVTVKIIFFGNEEAISSAIKTLIKEHNSYDVDYKIVHCSDNVTMKDEATVAIKQKKDSSMRKGLEAHKNNEVDAFISAGNTGAMMSTSTVLLGRIKGVSRPTIGTFFPSAGEYPKLILDAGANVDSKPKFLYEFAIMGSLYFQEMLGLSSPKVGLLNVGEEESKGNVLAQDTYKLLKNSDLNFIGNIEGRDILMGKADIVVCDGFTGNIILKFAESFLSFLKASIKNYAKRGLFNKLKVGLMIPTLKDVLKDFDYQEHGGVPLLGVNGVSIIGHGSSNGKAMQNMIIRSIEIVQKDLNNKIDQALN